MDKPSEREEKQDSAEELLPVDYLLINYRTRLFGVILVLLEKAASEAIPTACVSVREGRGHMLYNKTFMEELTHSERCFVLMHEASHIIMSSMSRGVERQKDFWNIATDIIINSLLIKNFNIQPPKDLLTYESLEKMGVKPADVFIDIRMASADEIYKALIQAVKSIRQFVAVENGRAKRYAEIETKGGKKYIFRIYGEDFDEEMMDGVFKNRINDMLKDAAELYGTAAGEFLKALGKLTKVSFPFDMVLKKIFEKREYDFSRSNRRFRPEGSFFPRRKNEAFKVYAAVDVSGSCYDHAERFLSYITALPEFEEVIFFDTGITGVMKKGDPMPTALRGFGGTDINPVMKRWVDIERRVSGTKLNFVALTDGCVAPIIKYPKTEPLILTTGVDIPGCRNIRIR